jgi:hypothetical protein
MEYNDSSAITLVIDNVSLRFLFRFFFELLTVLGNRQYPSWQFGRREPEGEHPHARWEAQIRQSTPHFVVAVEHLCRAESTTQLSKDNLRGVLNLSSPIQRGVIDNQDYMKNIWDYCYSELKLQKKDVSRLLRSDPCSADRTREQS